MLLCMQGGMEAEGGTFEYDLFIVHTEADEPFVLGYLLLATGLAPGRVMLSSALGLGALKMVELERGVQSSRFTLVVLSPAFTADRLAEFAELLASHASGVEGRLVPLLLADCELPLRLDVRVLLDFRDSSRWAEEGQKLRRHLQQQAPAPVDVPCPYPGMRPYSADAAAYFYGRDAEVDELVGRLRAGEREIYVIGPSGSGKSSLIAAGVLPRLARGGPGIPGLGPFLVLSMRPGERPAAQLGKILEASESELAAPATAIGTLLTRQAPGGSVLIVVDQLEELFTLESADEHSCARFLVALRALRAEPRCALVFTLRADFYGAFMENPLWQDLRGRLSRIEVGPLGEAELRVAIAQPARDVGVYFEPELIERLLADSASEPGILPLLQETLVQLWDRRQLRLLTLAAYHELGDRNRSGLAVALSRRADSILRELPRAQEAIARRILLRLISFGEGRSDTRRQQPRSKLRAVDDDVASFDLVLRRLITARLLTADEDDEGGEARIDLAHEAMITAWPTLAGWIQSHRTEEQHRRQLEAAAGEWVKRGRGAGGLLDPIELAEAETWQKTDSARELGQSADVAALVTASRAAHDRQRRRRRGLLWGAFAVLATFVVVVSALAVMASQRAREAEANRRQAEADRTKAETSDRESQRLLAQSYKETGRQLLLEGYLPEAMPYLMEARLKGEEGESLQMLISMAARASTLEHRQMVNRVAFSPDGTRVITASYDGTMRVWNAATGQPLGTLFTNQDMVKSVAFSPNGTRVVTASDYTQVWDAATGQPLGAPLMQQGEMMSAAFSPDGTRVVTASADGTARVWDVATGQPLGAPLAHQVPMVRPALSPHATLVVRSSPDRIGREVWDIVTGKVLAHRKWVNNATFSPDGSRVVTASADGTARVWDTATSKLIGTPLAHQGEVWSAAFSPDGARVVTASADRTARVWNAATGKPIGIPLAHQKWVNSAAFSPDGSRVVTASDDRTARVWEAVTGKPVGIPLAHQGEVVGAAFAPDGSRVVTASWDGTARVWDAATGQPIGTPLAHQGHVVSAAFSPNGTHVVTASADGTARVWDTAIGNRLGTPLKHQGVVCSAAFSSDGTRVITVSLDQTARVWDTVTGKPLGPPLTHQGEVWRAAFNPDGSRVVTASWDQTAQIWDTATGQPLGTPLTHQGEVWRAAFNPDGSRVVTASEDGTARIWDAATGQPLGAPLTHQDAVRSAAFSPDGSRVVTMSADGTARIWDAATARPLGAQPLGPPLTHQDVVRSAEFSPEGCRVVTASEDGTAQIWDAATGKPLGPALRHQSAVTSAAFSLDGSRVVTVSWDQTARVWDAANGKPIGSPLAHQSEVRSAVFSPDGTRIVTASNDGTARVWDAATGRPLGAPLKHQEEVNSAAFSPDGTRVVTASNDGTARVWEIGLDKTLPKDWSALAARSPFVLVNGVHVLRSSLVSSTGDPRWLLIIVDQLDELFAPFRLLHHYSQLWYHYQSITK
jgi:WD40 repeat protein